MSYAYVDTSILLSLAFDETTAHKTQQRLNAFDAVYASRFLEAEYLSAFKRESKAPVRRLLDPIQWVDATAPMRLEFSRVLDAGYVRGADCWHLATALHAASDPAGWTFLTHDMRQRDVAKTLGFQV